jgi:hypothetical protein
VFSLLQREDFRVDVTLLEKARVYGRLGAEEGLYRLAWYIHFENVVPWVAPGLLAVVAADGSSCPKRSDQSDALWATLSKPQR